MPAAAGAADGPSQLIVHADMYRLTRIDLAIAITSPTARTLTITGYGPAHAGAVAAMQRG